MADANLPPFLKPLQVDPAKVVTITYCNHRNEIATRHILPGPLQFTTTAWHPVPQWILWAWDLDKQAKRGFAMQSIMAWQGSTPEAPHEP